MSDTDDLISARRIAASAEILDIRLFETSVKLLHLSRGQGSLSYGIDVNPVVQHASGADHFVLETSYVVTISDSESSGEGEPEKVDDDDDAGVLARIRFSFGALYQLGLGNDEPEVSQDEFDAYARTAGLLFMFPYAREHVSYMTRSLGLPDLILPLFKLPFVGAPDPLAVKSGR